jgi:hypothetical protein
MSNTREKYVTACRALKVRSLHVEEMVKANLLTEDEAVWIYHNQPGCTLALLRDEDIHGRIEDDITISTKAYANALTAYYSPRKSCFAVILMKLRELFDA